MVQIYWFKMEMQGVQGERHLVLREQKNKGNICYLDGQVLKRNHYSKVKKKVKFSNVVEVLGDTSVGGEFVHFQID